MARRQRIGLQIRDMNAVHPHMQPQEGRHQRAIRPPGQKGVRCPGTPPIYDPIRFPHMGNVLCKEYGFTAMQMAEVFGVSKKTVEAWMMRYPEFKVAVKAGRDEFDSCKVENVLLKIALGYEYQEKSVKTVSVRGVDSEGKTIRVPAKETTLTTKQYAPNAKAIALWLTNRQPDRWKLTSTVNAEITSNTVHTENRLSVTADLNLMDSNQLRALRDLISTQKTETLEIEHKEETPMMELMDKANRILEAEVVEV